MFKKLALVACICLLFSPFGWLVAQPAPEASSIIVDGKLPFEISLSLADFQLPKGVHSGVIAIHDGKWLILAGRHNGLHGFSNSKKNFPPKDQNTTVFVVDPEYKTIYKRSLLCESAGLTQKQIDSLSVTSPQFYQEGNTLYITGGYGYDTASKTFGTKDTLTAIDVPKLIDWVIRKGSHRTAAKCIRQIFDPIFSVTGGYMTRMEDHSTLLVFGQDFSGYYLPNSNGYYTRLVRRFNIIDDGTSLSVVVRSSQPKQPNPDYRRRDLNVIPSIKLVNGVPTPYLIAYSGVFTPEGNAWMQPVAIDSRGHPSSLKSSSSNHFKQGMNNYVCATIGLFSAITQKMYSILLGGISLEYYENGVFQTDTELPFINQVTTIELNKKGRFTQYLMDAEYPILFSTKATKRHCGKRLLFGTGADFVLADGIPQYENGVVNFDALKTKIGHKKEVLLGYVVGGIESIKPNTSSRKDSTASPYIFKVKLTMYRR